MGEPITEEKNKRGDGRYGEVDSSKYEVRLSPYL
jgi:hypothetical protein